ncbi:unnamed protein product [Arabidopsis halleri]
MHLLTKPPHQIFNSFSRLTRESSQTSLYSILRDKKTYNTLTMPEKTRHTKALTATILTAMAFLAFPMIIKASDSSTNRKLEEDPIKCTPCLQNIPPPPPSPPPPSRAVPDYITMKHCNGAPIFEGPHIFFLIYMYTNYCI